MENIPYGYCHCGCGQKTKIAKQNTTLYKTREPRLYLVGHANRRQYPEIPNPNGLCLCGCGKETAICKSTDSKRGKFKGKHCRYIIGHTGQLNKGKVRTDVTKGMMSLIARNRSPEIRQKIWDTRKRNGIIKNVGDKVIDSRGYVRIKITETNGKRCDAVWKMEHRVVVEKSIGRLLTSVEAVHHIDGNHSNNSIDNLVILTKREHYLINGIINYINAGDNRLALIIAKTLRLQLPHIFMEQ